MNIGNIGFVGSGRMAEAMVASLIHSKQVEPHSIFASDVRPERRRAMREQYKIITYSRNSDVLEVAETVFLCVKPQVLDEVLSDLSDDVTEDHLIISIAAGKRIGLIEKLAPREGVEEVEVTDEDESFPPPRNLRDLLASIDVAATLSLGGPVHDRVALDDRNIDASDVLESLALTPIDDRS